MSRPDLPPEEPGEVYSLDLEGDADQDREAIFKEAVEAVEKKTEGASETEMEANPEQIAQPPTKLEGESPRQADGDPVATQPTEAEDVAELEAEVAELRERYLRTLADLDNQRRRNEREREELRRFAIADPMREFLAVLDNLERAVIAQGTMEDLKRGVEMILRQVQDMLERFGVKEIKATGEAFDPAFHEAVSRQEEAVEVPTVVDELQRGYMLHERLLRPAMVRVAVPPEASPTVKAEDEPVDEDRIDEEPKEASSEADG